MPNWSYEARDVGGNVVRGAHEAPDRRAALEFLRAQGLFLTKLEEVTGRFGVSRPTSRPVAQEAPSRPTTATVSIPTPTPRPISTSSHPNHTHTRVASAPIVVQPLLRANSKELSLFFRQMGAMIHAGTTIGAALHSMSEHAPNAALRQAAAQMERRTMSGETMSESMRPFPGLFSPLQIGMVSAGERGGFLDTTFARLTKYSERDYELQQTIKSQTWYPQLLVWASIFIPGAVPLVLALVNGGQNPFLAWIASVGPLILVLGVAYAVYRVANYAAPLASHQSAPKLALDGLKLRLPIIGKVTRGLAASKFCRALGALYGAGVGPGESVRLAADACGNAVMAKGALEIIPRLESGQRLTDSLASTGHFPTMALQMMQVGEESGSLDTQLDKTADFLESDAEVAIKQAVQALGILIFIAIAIRIGIQVGQFYLGYFNAIFEMADAV